MIELTSVHDVVLSCSFASVVRFVVVVVVDLLLSSDISPVIYYSCQCCLMLYRRNNKYINVHRLHRVEWTRLEFGQNVMIPVLPWSTRNRTATSFLKSNETGILWAYIEKERGLPVEGINTRYNPRLPYSRWTEDDMDRQHKIVVWVVTDRTNKEGGR